MRPKAMGGGFKARMEHYVYSGEKKHVLAGIGIFTVIFGIPWIKTSVSPRLHGKGWLIKLVKPVSHHLHPLTSSPFLSPYRTWMP
ncbi:hypothetical protein Bca4012_028185 [Brassica carinata]